jgi:glycerol-3-phosphate acyltransferase PlsY
MPFNLFNQDAWLAAKPDGYSRALMHVLVTLTLAAVAWFIPRPLSLWALTALAVLFFIFELVRLRLCGLNGFFYSCFRTVLRPEEWWHPTGASYVLWGAMAAALCFSREVAVAAICFLAVGDAASSAVGNYLYGKRIKGSARPYRSLGCLAACAAVGLALSLAGINLGLPVLMAGAFTVTIIEALPLPLNDNLSLPLAAGLIMTLLSL